MDGTNKRKAPPVQHSEHGDTSKKKRGNNNKWQTPVQKARMADRASIDPGMMGVWASCARSMEGRATIELRQLFDDYAEVMYGIRPAGEQGEDEDEDDRDDDIEASIAKELDSLKTPAPDQPKRTFRSIRVNMACVLFIETQPPVDPVQLVRRICEDAAQGTVATTRRTRYLNRLTPISLLGKATTRGLEEVARSVLGGTFVLKPSDAGAATEQDQTAEEASRPAFTYAIRPSIRNHTTLERGEVIKQIAAMIDDRHKVNLGAPDKVILLDIYQTVCGLSVVDGDWEQLKRYNLAELFGQASKGNKGASKGGAAAAASETAAPGPSEVTQTGSDAMAKVQQENT